MPELIAALRDYTRAIEANTDALRTMIAAMMEPDEDEPQVVTFLDGTTFTLPDAKRTPET